MQMITTIGLDIAKSVFQVHGVDAAGEVVIRDGRRKAAFLVIACRVHRCVSASIMLDADPTLRFRQCPISLVVSVALSAHHQIAQQIRSHR